MCWVGYRTKLGSKQFRKKAEEDIPVFKVCLKDIWNNESNLAYAYYYQKKYEVGKTYTECVRLVRTHGNHPIYKIKEGLHCYSDKCNLEAINDCLLVKFNKTAIDYHPSGDKLVRLDCIIPKGTRYYINDTGEIVTTKIIVKGVNDIEVKSLKQNNHYDYG